MSLPHVSMDSIYIAQQEWFVRCVLQSRFLDSVQLPVETGKAEKIFKRELLMEHSGPSQQSSKEEYKPWK